MQRANSVAEKCACTPTHAPLHAPLRSHALTHARALDAPTHAPTCFSQEVTDNGPGVAPECAALLFQPFSQLSTTVAGGSGLGLLLCKQLVELSGGVIGVDLLRLDDERPPAESSPPPLPAQRRGARFFFEIPADGPLLEGEGKAAEAASSGGTSVASAAPLTPRHRVPAPVHRDTRARLPLGGGSSGGGGGGGGESGLRHRTGSSSGSGGQVQA